MSETKRNWRNDLKILRERMGGVSEQKKAWSKQQRAEVKVISEALQQGPRTVPEIAARVKLPGPTVLWYVMALKRYGKVAESGRAGDYYQYEWKEARP
jgi:predicted transcriptional regulator